MGEAPGEETKVKLNTAQSVIDKASKKGVIHKLSSLIGRIKCLVLYHKLSQAKFQVSNNSRFRIAELKAGFKVQGSEVQGFNIF